MKNDDPLSDLEVRLRAWRPAGLPPSLHTRLRAADPAARRGLRRPHWQLAGVCALAMGAALVLANHFLRPPDTDPGLEASPALRHTVALASSDASHWVLGQSLTMNICTGVPPGSVPAAWRLDDQFVAGSGLIPIRSTDGKLPLKVDCQF